MAEESAADIIKYLDIVEGTQPIPLKEGDIIHLGINTQGVEVGKRYIFDSGIQWALIVEETESHWHIECGLIEHDADNNQYISKREMSSMVSNGEMILYEIDYSDTLLESIDEDDDKFNSFMMNVDRYLLINHMMESDNLNYAWKVAWAEGREPAEACEEAIILEG